MRRLAKGCCVAATCRSGGELGAVRGALGTGLSRFFEDIPLKLELVPLTADERAQMVRSMGHEPPPPLVRALVTPGLIAMANPLASMRERYRALSADRQAVIHALRLLVFGGVLPMTIDRVAAVLREGYGQDSARLAEHLEELRQQGFLEVDAYPTVVHPEPAFLFSATEYRPNRQEYQDLFALELALHRTRDPAGLTLLATARHNVFGDSRSALRLLDDALMMDPDRVATLLRKGGVYMDLERYEDALPVLQRATRIAPNRPDVLHNLGIVLDNLGQSQDALAAYDQAIELDPTGHHGYYNRGIAFMRAERYAEALADFDRALTANPYHARSLGGRGAALLSLGRAAEALEAIDRSIALRSDDAPAWTNRAAALEALGRPTEAVEALRRSVELNPPNANAWLALGRLLHELGEPAKAAEVWARAQAFHPGDPRYVLLEAAEHVGADDAAKALESLARATDLDPASVEAWRIKGAVLRSLKRTPEAIEALMRARELGASDAGIHRDLARLLLESTMPAGTTGVTADDARRHRETAAAALRETEQGLQQAPGDADLRRLRATALTYAGRDQDALAEFEQLLDVEPDDPQALHNRALTLARLGRTDDAVSAFDEFLARRPGAADALFDRATVLQTGGRHAEAVAAFDDAARAGYSSAEVAVRKAHSLLELGRPVDAAACLDAVAAAAEQADAQFWIWKSMTELTLGRIGDAEESARRATDLTPDNSEAWGRLGLALRVLHRIGDAVAAFERTCAAAPGDDVIRVALDELRQGLEETRSALTQLDDELREHPEDGVRWEVKANLHYAIGEFAEALAAFRAAAAVRPGTPQLLESIGNCLSELERYEDALVAFDEALALDPQDVGCWYNKAVVLIRLHRGEEATRWFCRVVRSGDSRLGELPTALLASLGTDASECEAILQSAGTP